MKHALSNEHGFAIVYGLVILLLVTVAGTALLFLARRDRDNATDYSKMRTASQAAMAALKACEGQFLNNPAEALAILTQFKTNASAKWMLGTAANATTEQKIAIESGADAPRYSAKIVRYDDVNALVVIEGIGYLPNGGKKKALATYRLSGIGIGNLPIGSTYGLFLGGCLQNCNATISIKGDVYLSMANSSPQHFNKGGIIEGNLKTLASANKMDLTSGGKLTVTGNALMQCQMEPQDTFVVKGKAGFTGTFSANFTKAMLLDGDAYFTQTANFGFVKCVDGDDGGLTTLYYETTKVSADRFKDFDYMAQIPTSTATYVATQLGMTEGSESPLGLNLPASWGTGVVDTVTGTITGENVDTYWNTHKTKGTLYQNEWLVLQVGSGGVSTNGGTFTKKVVWLVTGSKSITANMKWYNCDDASNTLLIVQETASIGNMGVGDNCRFRGLIYVSSTSSNMQYKFGKKTRLYGAIIHSNSAQFNLNDGPTDSLRLWYSEPLGQSAIQEIVNTGLVVAPGQTSPTARVPVLVDTKIRPTQLNLQM